MGCDIHLYREKLVGGKWITADKWTQFDYGEDDKGVSVDWDDRAYTGRNYELFGLLSDGVRTTHSFSFQPKGIAADACPEVWAEIDRWGVDGHGHSYLTLSELKAKLAELETCQVLISGMKDPGQLEVLKGAIKAKEPNCWDLLYPYCKWTSDKTFVQFEIEVPASYSMGKCLKDIISSFDNIDGDDHRIVFFFDN